MRFISVLAFMIAVLPVGASEAVSFHRDVEPVLQANCQQCHRPGEAAPMSFLTYEETRPWARAIHEAVALNRMPPWFADPRFGEWSNAHVLTPEEKRVLIEWAETGAERGDPSDAPSPLAFVDGWNIGEPDFVLEIVSPSTWRRDLGAKRARYAALGVGEYWLHDPHGRYLKPALAGYRLVDGSYVPLPSQDRARGLSIRSDVLALDVLLEGERLPGIVVDEVDLAIAVPPVVKAHPCVRGEGVDRRSYEVLQQGALLDRIVEGSEAAMQRGVADCAVHKVQLAAAPLDRRLGARVVRQREHQVGLLQV